MNRTIILLVGAVLVVGLLVLLRGRIDRGFVAPSSSRQVAALPPNVEERLHVNMEHHLITVVKRGKHGETQVTEMYVPRRAVVDVRHDGVSVNVQRFGVDLSPELGLAYASDLRLYCGISVLYYGRYNLITGVAFHVNHHTPDAEGVLAIKRDLTGSLGVWIGTTTNHPIAAGVSYRFALWGKV